MTLLGPFADESHDAAFAAGDDAPSRPAADADPVVLKTTNRSGRPRQRPRVVVLSALALMICTGGPYTYLYFHVFNGPNGKGLWLMLYPNAAVAIGGAFALVHHLRSISWRQWPPPLFAAGAYAIWAILSATWSVSPQVTSQNALIGAGMIAFGCWFGLCLTTAEQISALTVACSTLVLISAALIRWMPQYAKTYPDLYPDTLWQGVFVSRNSLAPVCVLGLLGLAGWVALRLRPLRILAAAGLAIPHVILLRGSGGATSMAGVAAAMLVAMAVPFVSVLRRWRIPGVAVGGAVGATVVMSTIWAFSNIEAIARRLDRDVTLSGRRLIWADVRGFIRERPIAGYGFWGFWDRPDLTAETYDRLQFAYGSAHNSVLEVMLGLGVIGLIFFLMIALWAIIGLAHLAWHQPSLRSWWWPTVFAFVLVENVTESFVLWHSCVWVLFVAAAFIPFNAANSALPGKDADIRRASLESDMDDIDDTDEIDIEAGAQQWTTA